MRSQAHNPGDRPQDRVIHAVLSGLHRCANTVESDSQLLSTTFRPDHCPTQHRTQAYDRARENTYAHHALYLKTSAPTPHPFLPRVSVT